MILQDFEFNRFSRVFRRSYRFVQTNRRFYFLLQFRVVEHIVVRERLFEHHQIRMAAMANLMMFEQPLAHDDMLDHAKLQKEIKTPIFLENRLLARRCAKGDRAEKRQNYQCKAERVGTDTHRRGLSKSLPHK